MYFFTQMAHSPWFAEKGDTTYGKDTTIAWAGGHFKWDILHPYIAFLSAEITTKYNVLGQ